MQNLSKPGYSPAERIPMPAVKSAPGNSPIHHIAQGDGPPLIFIHGMAASLHDWDAMLPALAASGYRGYAPDLLGHGESAKPQEASRYQAQEVYRLLESWIESLALPQPPVLIGHSLGGYFSLLYARRNPHRLRALVLIAPYYSPAQISFLLRTFNRRPQLSEKLLRLVPGWLFDTLLSMDPASTARFSEASRRQIANDYKRASPHILYTAASLEDLSPWLGQITTRTLVIWGSKDLTLAPKSFPPLVASLPKARGVPVRGCGHQPHIGQPETVSQMVIDFLSSQEIDVPGT